MAFNRELAERISRQRDRDRAVFFAGRDVEIQAFDDAVQETADGLQAVFRVFQGAPGCGKTSLAAHLADTMSNRTLFVSLDNEDLRSRGALGLRLDEAAAETANRQTRLSAMALQAVAAALRAKEIGQELRDALTAKSVREAVIVLHLDEAQTVAEAEADVLRGLHRRGLGRLPTVCLFTGLSHTADRIRSLEGLSRLAKNAVVNMVPLTDEECAESTARMLERLGIGSSSREGQEALAVVVVEASGWPQHLFCAQQALCRELLCTNGDLDAVGFDKVRTETAADRRVDYEGRLGTGELARWPKLVAAVAVRVMREHVRTEPELTKLCRRETTRLGLDEDEDFDVDPLDFVRQMVEKGVLSQTPERRYVVPIPSMETWLASISLRAPHSRPG